MPTHRSRPPGNASSEGTYSTTPAYVEPGLLERHPLTAGTSSATKPGQSLYPICSGADGAFGGGAGCGVAEATACVTAGSCFSGVLQAADSARVRPSPSDAVQRTAVSPTVA